MKNVPNRTIHEIAKKYLDRIGLTIEQVRATNGQEVAWINAKISIAAHKEGWGGPAIGRYLGLTRYAAVKHWHERDRTDEQKSDSGESSEDANSGRDR